MATDEEDRAFLASLEGGSAAPKPAAPKAAAPAAASASDDDDRAFLAGLDKPAGLPDHAAFRRPGAGQEIAGIGRAGPRGVKEPTVGESAKGLAKDALSAFDEPDRVAPGGLTGLVTGKRVGTAQPIDTSIGATVNNRIGKGLGFGLGPMFGALVDTGVSQIPGVRNAAEAVNNLSLPEFLGGSPNGGHHGLSPLTNPNLTYAQRLAEYRARDDAQAGAHPIVAPLAETIAGLAPQILTAGTVLPATAASNIGAGIGAGRALGRAVATGAGYGAVGAAADTRSPTLVGKLKDIGAGAAVSAVLGGGTEAAAGALTRNAGKRLANDITREITEGSGEHGAATATAARLVARDKEDIVKLVTSDGEIAKAVRQPAAKGLPVIKAKIAEEGAQLDPHYDVVDETVGGVRVGDWVDHMEKAAAKLRATAKGKDAKVAGQIEAAATRAREAADWGGGSHFDPNVEVTPGVTAAQQIALMERVAKVPAQSAAANAEIARVRGFATKPGYNPDKIVPTQQLRGVVTDLQGTAYDALGGINNTENHQKAREVAHAGENFLRAHLDKAEKASDAAAQAVSEIRRINPRFSALKNIEKAMDQRGDRENRGATSLRAYLRNITHGAGAVAAAQAVYRGHPGEAALELATAYALPKLAHILPPHGNRALARLVAASTAGNVPAALVTAAIEGGVPRAIAMKLAGAVSASGVASEGE